jgi:exodeoxyribonuclease VII large subunit
MSQPSLDLGYEDLPDPTYSVRELADAVNQVLRRGFGDGVWVRGEVEGLQQRANGHVYFSLTERDSDGQATIAVALFANTAYRLRGLLARHRLTLRNGLNVRIHGTLDFYAPNGRLSLKMDGLDPTFTLGRLAADRDQLLRRLVGEGLLDRNRRLIVPVAPLRVGLVTSRGSAAWHDVITELERSGYAFHLVHVDVRVQGQGAAEQVAAALRTLGRYGVDIICVVRGGGSRSDLATFDSEVVARAIAASPVPVLTGLGHEIDRSVADEVAHTALKTPTACAVHLVERVRDAAQETEARWAAIGRAARAVLTAADTRTEAVTGRIAARTRHAVDVAEARLEADVARARRSTAAVLVRESARVERAAGRVEGAARRQAAVADRELTRLAGRLGPRARRLPDDAARRLDGIDARLRALDPARTLARGWSITRRSDGSIVRSAADLAMGDELTTTFAQGSARSRVEGVDDATAG